MALAGNAFLIIWHDVKPEAESDYLRWHTREHMPERLGIPGFEVRMRFLEFFTPCTPVPNFMDAAAGF
jgi:hypothetical protein